VILELLESGSAVNEIASKYKILPKSLITWKKQFFENASSLFENTVSTKKYKDEIKEKEEKIENLEKTLGVNDYGKYKSRMLLCGCKKKSGAWA